MGWLEKVLEKSEKNGEFVLILCHFPTNSRFVVKGSDVFNYCLLPLEFGIRLASLKERYANIIRGVMYGHNHEDFLEITNSFADSKPFTIGFSNPSLSPYYCIM